MSWQNYKDLMSPMTTITVLKIIKQQSKLKHKFINTVCHIMHVGFRNLSVKSFMPLKYPLKLLKKLLAE